jgi:hypothetical protein
VVKEEGKEPVQITAKALVPKVVAILKDHAENEKLVVGSLLAVKVRSKVELF